MIFVDTSFWVALRNRRDTHHEQAHALLKKHVGSRLVTSDHVRGETWTFLRRRAGHAAAVNFLDVLENSKLIEVQRVGATLEAQALAWLRRHDEREYSFVDATSFEFMRSKGIFETFAFDSDFTAAGFVELR